MLKLICPVFCLLFPTTTFAQTSVMKDIESYSSLDLSSLNREDFVREQREILRTFWEPSMLMFARVDPSLEALVPDFVWTDEHATVYGCLYDELSAKDALDTSNVMLKDMLTSVAYIEANPDFHVGLIDEHPEFFDLLMPDETFANVSFDCGVNALNAKTMTDSGLMQAFVEFSRK